MIACQRLFRPLALVATCLCLASANASNYTANGTDPDDWFDAGNWDVQDGGGTGPGVPSQAGNIGAVFVGGTPYTMTGAGATGATSLFFVVGGTDTLTIEGGDLTYDGDGLIGTDLFSAGGATNVTQTGGAITQQAGSNGLLIGHQATATWDISGGSMLVEGTAPSLTIDFGGAAPGSELNISGSGLVTVDTGIDLVLGAGGTLNVTDSGKLVWRDRTLADVASLGGIINATAMQVNSDIEFVAGAEQEFQLKVLVDRDTGTMEIQNNTGAAIDIASYSIVSTAGTLNSDNWTSIADGDSNWDELTSTGSRTDLGEATVGSLSIANGGSIQLDNDIATAWIQYFEENELSFSYEDVTTTNPDGTGEIVEGIVRYTGNGGEAFLEGDLNFSGGDPDAADWDAFVAGYGTDLTGKSLAEAYALADLTGDGAHSFADFSAFETLFDAVNGAGALSALVSSQVPEPSAGILAGMVGLCVVMGRRLRSVSLNVSKLSVLVVAGLAFAFGAFPQAAHSQELIVNGDFELAANPPALDAANNTDWDGWTEIAGTSAPVGWVEGVNFGVVDVPDSGDAGTIVANIAALNAIEQNIATVIGETYTLSYQLGGLGGSAAPDYLSTVVVTADGATLDTHDVVQTAGGAGFFDSFSLDFMATDTLTTIRFENTVDPTTNDFGPVVDNVSVVGLAGATPMLEINLGSGELFLTGGVDSLDINFYELTGPSGSLAPGSWQSGNLDAQNIDEVNGGATSADSWSTLAASTDNLTEAFLNGSSVFDENRTESLGIGFNTASGVDVETELQMLVGLVGGATRLIDIVAIPGEEIQGDYNGDGVVNIADYTVWRDNLGANLTLNGENPGAVTPGVVDTEDYTFWKSRLGATTNPGLLVAQVVPEPSAAVTVLIGCAAAFAAAYRRRRVQETVA